MVLVSIAGVDVTVLRLEQIVALMNTSTRPVVLGWKRANAAAEHEHNHVAGSGGIVGEGTILDDLDFDLRDPLYDEAGVEEAPVFEQMMSGVERVKMGRELQGAFF